MTEFQTIIYFLAVFALTYLVRHTNGIFDIFLKFRMLLGMRYRERYLVEDENHKGRLETFGAHLATVSSGKVAPLDMTEDLVKFWSEKVDVFKAAIAKGEKLIIGRDELPTFENDPWYTKMIDCFWCLGSWIAGILYGLYFVIPFGFFIWLAAIGVSGVMYTILENGETENE